MRPVSTEPPDMETEALIQFATETGMLIAQSTSGGSSALAFLAPLLIMGGLFYLVLVVPQRKRQGKMQSMRESIVVGDEVRTVGGIIGTIVRVDDDVFTIDVGGQNIRIIRRAIAAKHGNGES